MAEPGMREAVDLLEEWIRDYNARAGVRMPLECGGEVGGAQLRLKYAPAEGEVSIFHLVAGERDGRPVILAARFDGPAADASVRAGLWASAQLGRRPGWEG